MTSEDRIIIELINSRFDASEKNNAEKFEMINGQLVQLRKDVDELKAEVRDVKHDVQWNSKRIDDLHSFFGIGVTIIAIVIALVGFVMALAPMFREMYRDRREERRERAEYVTRSDMEVAIADAVSEAVSKALRMK